MNYRKYKPFLRLDFNRRCAYCEITEPYAGGKNNFGIDHFKPKAKFPELLCLYTNLYYSCNRCNSIKRDTWPSQFSIGEGFHFVDPCASDIYGVHLQELPDGTLECLTNAGRYTKIHLDLDRDDLIEWRLDRRTILLSLPLLQALSLELAQRLHTEPDEAKPAINRQLEDMHALYKYLLPRVS